VNLDAEVLTITADVKTTATVAELKMQYAFMGTIRIEVWREKTSCLVKAHRANNSPDAIPEVALKGRAIEVGIGCVSRVHVGINADKTTRYKDAKPTNTLDCWETTPVDDQPLSTFIFFYRSKSMWLSFSAEKSS